MIKFTFDPDTDTAENEKQMRVKLSLKVGRIPHPSYVFRICVKINLHTTTTWYRYMWIIYKCAQLACGNVTVVTVLALCVGCCQGAPGEMSQRDSSLPNCYSQQMFVA